MCVCDVKGANWTFVKKKYSFQKKNIFTKFFKDFQKTLKTSLSFVTVSRMYLQLSLNNLASATPSTVVMLTPTQTWPPCVTTTTTTTKRQKLRIFLKSTFQNRTGKTVQHWSLILVSTYARKKILFLKKILFAKKNVMLFSCLVPYWLERYWGAFNRSLFKKISNKNRHQNKQQK